MTNAGRLKTIHDFGAKNPTPEMLAPYKANVIKHFKEKGYSSSKSTFSKYDVLPFIGRIKPKKGQKIPQKTQYMLKEDVDVIHQDGRYSLDELALYHYRLDHSAPSSVKNFCVNGDGKVTEEEQDLGVALSSKNYIKHWAERSGLSKKHKEKLENLLVSNRFSASGETFEQSFDIAQTRLEDDYTTAMKAYTAAENIDNAINKAGKNDSATVIKNMLTVLVEDSPHFKGKHSMPTLTDIKRRSGSKELETFNLRQFSPFEKKFDNGFTGYGLHERNFEVTLPYSWQFLSDATIKDKPIKHLASLLLKEIDSYRVPSEQSVPEWEQYADKLRAEFNNPDTKAAIDSVENNKDLVKILSGEMGKEDLKKQLRLVASSIQRVWDLPDVRFEFSNSKELDDVSATMGRFNANENKVTINLENYTHKIKIGMYDHLSEEEKRSVMSKEIFHFMVHEYSHALQESLRKKLKHSPGDIPEGLKPLVRDFKDNQISYGHPDVLRPLTGNPVDYLKQPDEKRAEDLAKKVLNPESGQGN